MTAWKRERLTDVLPSTTTTIASWPTCQLPLCRNVIRIVSLVLSSILTSEKPMRVYSPAMRRHRETQRKNEKGVGF